MFRNVNSEDDDQITKKKQQNTDTNSHQSITEIRREKEKTFQFGNV